MAEKRPGLRGTRDLREDAARRMIMPTSRHVVIDVQNLNANEEQQYVDVPEEYWDNRCCYCDTAGIVKVGYIDGVTGEQRIEVLTLGTNLKQISLINRVYGYYIAGDEATKCTSYVYKDDGTRVLGIKLRM